MWKSYWWRHIRKVRSETRDPRPISYVGPGTLKVEPETRDTIHTWDRGSWRRGPRPGTVKVDFRETFSVFSDASRIWMNSCALCVYVYFVCLSLPYHKAYAHLTFYHLNDLNLSSFQVFAKISTILLWHL